MVSHCKKGFLLPLGSQVAKRIVCYIVDLFVNCRQEQEVNLVVCLQRFLKVGAICVSFQKLVFYLCWLCGP